MSRLLDFKTHDTRKASTQSILLSLITFLYSLLPLALAHPSGSLLLCLGFSLWRFGCENPRFKIPDISLISILGVISIILLMLSSNVDVSIRAVTSLAVLLACRNLLSTTINQWSTTMMMYPLFPMGYFLDENPDWYVGYCIVHVCLLITTALSFWNSNSKVSKLLKQGFYIVALGLPAILLSFYLLPRPNSILKQQRGPTTGMSSTLKPGSIGKLAKSEALAFTATMDMELSSQDLYWRGAVLRDYDGFEWKENNTGLSGHKIITRGKQYTYTVVISDSHDGFRYVLEQPSSIKPLDSAFANYKLSGSAVLTSPIQGFIMYKASSSPSNVLLTEPTDPDYRVPVNVHTKTNALVKSLKSRSASPSQFLELAHSWIAQNGFVYSLEPGEMDGDWMDTFLFDRRKGFCEHYASTLTYMLRKAGYSARVVVGYQGGDYQQKSRMYLIPQAAAHAWSEYWDPTLHRWVRFDPTTWVAPERLAPFGWKESERELLARGKDNSAWGQFQFFAVHVSSQWNRWVSNYDADEQRGLLAKLKTEKLSDLLTVVLLVLSLPMLLLMRAHHLLYRDPKLALRRLERRLNGLGLKSPLGATTLMRIEHAISMLPKRTNDLTRWYAEYEKQAYAGLSGVHLGILTTILLLKLPYSSSYQVKQAWSLIKTKVLGKHNRKTF